MKIKNDIRELFKTHKAYYRDLGEVQILDWKKDDTFMYSIRYIFDGSKLYISGDYGCSVYWLTWKGTPASFKDVNLDYFYEKNEAHEGNKYSFNSKQAKENIKYHLDGMFEEFDSEIQDLKEEINDLENELDDLNGEDEFFEDERSDILHEIERVEIQIKDIKESDKYGDRKELLSNLLDLTEEADSNDHWAYLLAENGYADEIQEFDSDCWEWLYSVGESIPRRSELHLAGLILANEYLEKVKEEE